MPLESGAKIASLPPFSLVEPLASGPHCEVWRARGPDGDVALKRALTAPARARLKAEALLLGQLSHPALVRPVAVAENGAWLATRWVSGQGIEAWSCGRGPAEILEAGAQVAEGLSALHALGRAHGDIKPANLRVNDAGQVVLLDLGVSVASEPGFHGTPGFAAPEQLQGQPLSPACDAFALGVTLFSLLTGGHPFCSGASAQALVPGLRLPWTPSMVRPGLPQDLDGLMLALLHRHPQRRPAALLGVAQALRAAVLSPPLHLHPLVFARWRAVGGWVVQAQDQRDGGILVLHGPAVAAREQLMERLALAAAVEGRPWLRLQSGREPVPQGAFLWLDQPDLPDLADRADALWRQHRARVLLSLDRPDRRLMQAGAAHVALAPGLGAIGATSRASILENEGSVLILEALGGGDLEVGELARRLSLSPMDLLEAAEPLLQAGLVEERDGGRRLAAALSAWTEGSAPATR